MDNEELRKAEAARIKAEEDQRRAEARLARLQEGFERHEEKMERLRITKMHQDRELRQLNEVNKALEEDNKRRIRERAERMQQQEKK